MNPRLAAGAAVLSGLGLALALALAYACAPTVTNGACLEYVPGADMSTVSFGQDPSIEAQVVAYAQAAGFSSVLASQSLADTTNACRTLAVALGADASDPAAAGKAPRDLVDFWCHAAATLLGGVVGDGGILASDGGAGIAVFAPPCTTSVGDDISCQAGCNQTVSCTLTGNAAIACPGGAFACDCPGTCVLPDAAPDTTPVTSIGCFGACDGTCSGTCDGTPTPPGGAACDAGSTCSGACSGSCSPADAALRVVCSGTCQVPTLDGGSVPLECNGGASTVSCAGGMLGGGCATDVNCQKSCNLAANARASCPTPAVVVAPATTPIADAIAAAVPPLWIVGRMRGNALAMEVNDGVGADGELQSSAKLDAHGSACTGLMQADLQRASSDLSAAVAASTSVLTALGIRM